jgi:hypothetical protein
MKSVELPKGPLAGKRRSSQTEDPLPASSAHVPIPSPDSGTNCSGNARPDNDPTRAFLHQLSQTLTSLRGTLELALLDDSDAQGYRRVIQQALVQVDNLVQLFNAYRALAQGTNKCPRERVERIRRGD